MTTARRVVGTALLVATVALPAARRRAAPQAPPDPPREGLEQFEGVIDHGRQTNDVRSDLYVRAARALEAGTPGRPKRCTGTPSPNTPPTRTGSRPWGPA
jgi:hypothetical protein